MLSIKGTEAQRVIALPISSTRSSVTDICFSFPCSPSSSVYPSSSLSSSLSTDVSPEKTHRVRPYIAEEESKVDAACAPLLSKRHKTVPLSTAEGMHTHLIARGYLSLESAVREREDKAWEEIRTLSHPSFMEQTKDLYDLALRHESYEAARRFTEFSLALVRKRGKTQAQEFYTDIPHEETHAVLAKLIYLVGTDIKLALSLVQSDNVSKIISAIETTFEKEMLKQKAQLEAHEKKHAQALLQESKRARAVKLTLLITKMLITPIGTLNMGLIPYILENYLPIKGSVPHEKRIHYVLTMLTHNMRLRNLLCSIHAPKHPNSLSAQIIRVTLNLPPSFVLSEAEARAAALSGLLSHLRQGVTGSCFATYLAIQQSKNSLEKTLLDFRNLLEESKLVRNISGKEIEFPYLMRMSLDNAAERIKISSRGLLLKDGNAVFISEVPGFEAACRALGIKDINALIKEFFEEHKNPGTMEMSVQVFLKNLARLGKEVERVSGLIPHLIDRAHIAFEAETHNPLLRMWENAIANMAEMEIGSDLKKSVIQSIYRPMRTELWKAPIKYLEQTNNFLDHLQEVLRHRIQMQFDPSISMVKTDEEGETGHGGFVLYDRGRDLSLSSWQCVSTPKFFQEFVLSVLDQTIKGAVEKGIVSLPYVEKYLTTLKEFVVKVHFLENALRHYHLDNKKCYDLISEMHTLERTPWISRAGYNAKKIYSIFKEKEIGKVVSFRGSDATELLEKIIDFGKMSSSKLKERLVANPHYLIPLVKSSSHAASLMLGHPTLAEAWNHKMDTKTWIVSNLVKPGQAISDKIISKIARNRMIFKAESFITLTDRVDFHKAVRNIPNKLSVREFRNELLPLVRKFTLIKGITPEQFKRRMDAFLCHEALPQKDRHKLQKIAIHFLDSNWYNEVNDIHFCFIVNPGTGEIEIWKIYDDNNHLFPLDQAKWASGSPWELYLEDDVG